MPILDVEVVGRQAGDAPLEGLAERIAMEAATALGVHVIFEPDASGRVFFGGAPDLRAR